jgi:hypothetical protein
VGAGRITTVYLSQEAAASIERYPTWRENIDRALETIATDPYAPDWDQPPPSTLNLDLYDGCIVRDFPPFQYVYRFATEDEIEVLVVTLDFLRGAVMM